MTDLRENIMLEKRMNVADEVGGQDFQSTKRQLKKDER